MHILKTRKHFCYISIVRKISSSMNLLSRGLTCESFKLILPLIPRYGMVLVFPSESVSVIVDLSGNGLFVHPQFNFRGGFERNSL